VIITIIIIIIIITIISIIAIILRLMFKVLLTIDVQGGVFDDRFEALYCSDALESSPMVLSSRPKRHGHPLGPIRHQTHPILARQRRSRPQNKLPSHVSAADGQPQRRRRISADGDAPDVARLVLNGTYRAEVGARVTNVVDQQALNSR